MRLRGNIKKYKFKILFDATDSLDWCYNRGQFILKELQ